MPARHKPTTLNGAIKALAECLEEQKEAKTAQISLDPEEEEKLKNRLEDLLLDVHSFADEMTCELENLESEVSDLRGRMEMGDDELEDLREQVNECANIAVSDALIRLGLPEQELRMATQRPDAEDYILGMIRSAVIADLTKDSPVRSKDPGPVDWKASFKEVRAELRALKKELRAELEEFGPRIDIVAMVHRTIVERRTLFEALGRVEVSESDLKNALKRPDAADQLARLISVKEAPSC